MSSEARARILLVDDEPNIIKVMGKRLTAEGFEVDMAMDGEDALTKVRASHPDLIILDVMLPKLSGIEVCETLKCAPQYRDIPIVIVTAKAQARDRQQGFACGADAYLTKPFHAATLLEEIRRLLAQGVSDTPQQE